MEVSLILTVIDRELSEEDDTLGEPLKKLFTKDASKTSFTRQEIRDLLTIISRSNLDDFQEQ